MSALRNFGIIGLLCVAASCATHNTGASRPVTPKTSPKAYIHATFSGGLLNRRADAAFKLEENSYAMVAHLGGDGRIQVLFPEDPRETGFLSAGKWYRTPSFSAYYDGAPSQYSFAMTTYRGIGARMDSYDGLGHGYIFLVASKRPLDFDRLSEFGYWNDLAVDDYRNDRDPRESIRWFAEQVAGTGDFTLKFARSMGTVGMSSYADRQFDCMLMNLSWTAFGMMQSGYGLSWYRFGSPYLGNFDGHRLGRGYFDGCGYNAYAWNDRSFGTVRYSYTPTAKPPTPTDTTTRGDTLGRPPQFGRHAYRRPGEAGRAVSFTRPAFDRATEVARSSYRSRVWRGAETARRAGGTAGGSGSSGSGRGSDVGGVSRDSPARQTPRSTPRETTAERPARAQPTTRVERPVQHERPQAAPAAGKPSGGEERKP